LFSNDGFQTQRRISPVNDVVHKTKSFRQKKEPFEPSFSFSKTCLETAYRVSPLVHDFGSFMNVSSDVFFKFAISSVPEKIKLAFVI